MKHQSRTTAELLVVIGVIIAVLVGVFAVRSRDNEQSKRPSPASAVSTATAVVTATPSAALPGNVAVRTTEQAVARGEAAASDVGAKQPHLVSVKLESLRTAVIALQRPGEDPSAATQGIKSSELVGSVWLVEFDHDRFSFLTCPGPVGDATPAPCPTASTAAFVIRPSDGAILKMTLGLPVPR